MTNFELISLVKFLRIKDFKGVYCLDQLHGKVGVNECAIVNLDKSTNIGTHWVMFAKRGDYRIYFDSFGCVTPWEVQKYLKTDSEIKNNIHCIQRQTEKLQEYGTTICGQMCLFVLKLLNDNPPKTYDEIIKCFKDGSFGGFMSEISERKGKS